MSLNLTLRQNLERGLLMMFRETHGKPELWTSRSIDALLRIIEDEKQKAVEQALALAYKECCRRNVAEHGPEEFYKPVMERMFPKVD